MDFTGYAMICAARRRVRIGGCVGWCWRFAGRRMSTQERRDCVRGSILKVGFAAEVAFGFKMTNLGSRPEAGIAACLNQINALEATLRFIIVAALVLICQVAMAETVHVKYHGVVSLDAFACADVKESSDVSRICYDKTERYMVIQLKTTYYHYCEVDAATVQGLQMASSKRQFFETRIRGSGADGPFDCRTHPVPKKYRQ